MGVAETFHRTIDFLRRRKTAFQLTFGNNHIVTSLRGAYRKAFGNYAGQAVLIDLADFCRAAETCIVRKKDKTLDRDIALVLEGRREVWLRIEQHLRLRPEQLFALYNGQQFQITTEKDESDG